MTAPELPGLRFIEPLGTGGFSEVYLYERDQPRMKVAVKLLKVDVLDDNQRRQFAAEADTMAELAEHPFIVPVLGAGTAPDGRPFLEMRYYPPPDLGERVSAEPMSVPDALRTGIQLASAVETAHRSGIIHRDIKPANILVSSYGVPGLSDFGIAGRATETSDEDDRVGVSMPWSPPEVLTSSSNGSATSDVYSLAATIWNLLVGRAPFTIKNGDNTESAMFTRILHSRPPATGRAEVPGSLDRLLQQAMSKDPGHRPQSALEFARHLQRVEQELRLARTEIVVLEATPEAPAQPRTDLAEPSRFVPAPPIDATTPRGFEHRFRDKTPSVTPPATIGAPSVESAPATQRRPRTVSPTAHSRVATNPTTVRPRAVSTQPQDATPEEAATVHRPVQVAPTREIVDPRTEGSSPNRSADDPADPQPTYDRSGRARLYAIVASLVALVVVVVFGALLGRGGGNPKDADTGLPNGSGQTSAGGAAGGAITPPPPPDVTSEIKGGNVVFTWKPTGPSDRYTYTYGGQTLAATSRQITIPTTGNKQVCIRVTAVRAGVHTDSALTCGRS